MRILCFSVNPVNYRAANYQQEFLHELARQTSVTFYGPGFPNFDPALDSDGVASLIKNGRGYDCIVTSHTWISEVDGKSQPCSRLDLSSINIPKIGILNKEYRHLSDKLSYFNRNRFDVILSHHQDISEIGRGSQLEFVFWPFAVDGGKVSAEKKKTIDVGFSGILRNEYVPELQGDLRRDLMKEIFWTIGDLPIAKRLAYCELDIVWNAIPRSRRGEAVHWGYRGLKRIFPKYAYKRLPDDEYFEFLAQSKIIICTLSPLGLVSPRVYESMASGCVVLCESSDEYRKIFPTDTYITFDSPMVDFSKRIHGILQDRSLMEQVSRKAKIFVDEHHTWSTRVGQLISKSKEISGRK